MATRSLSFFATAALAFAGTSFCLSSAQAQTPVRNPTNNHYYAFIYLPEPLTWQQADAAARNSTFMGMQGYLVTITSEQENTFLIKNVYQADLLKGHFSIWLGGFRIPTATKPTVGWRWGTGEPWGYSRFMMGQPDNAWNHEDRLSVSLNFNWNDLPGDPNHEPDRMEVHAYVVEYGAITIPTPPKKSRQAKPGLKAKH